MQYKTGTVNLTNGSATVSGVGTAWLNQVEAGDVFIHRRDDGTDDLVSYTIANVSSNSQLQLSAPYQGSSGTGQAYGITRDFTEGGKPLLAPQSIGSVPVFNRCVIELEDEDRRLDVVKVTKAESLKNLPTINMKNQSVFVVDGYFGGSFVFDDECPSFRHDGVNFIFPNFLASWDGSSISKPNFDKMRLVGAKGCYRRINTEFGLHAQPTGSSRHKIFAQNRIGIRLSNNNFQFVPANVQVLDSEHTLEFSITFESVADAVAVFGVPGLNLCADQSQILSYIGTESVQQFFFVELFNGMIRPRSGSLPGQGAPLNIIFTARKEVAA